MTDTNIPAMVPPYQFPKLSDLVDNAELALRNDELNYLLNQQVPKQWIKEHPFVNIKINGQNVPLQYIAVEQVKLLLTQIFQVWESEIKSVQQIFNSVCVTVRLRVKNPLTGEWITHDGVGAVSKIRINIIYSKSLAHCNCVRRMIENFSRLYNQDTKLLIKELSDKQFQIIKAL